MKLVGLTPLPKKLAAKPESAWLNLERDLFDPKLDHAKSDELPDQTEYAVEVAFDATFVNERCANGHGLMPRAVIAAAVTRRARCPAAGPNAPEFPRGRRETEEAK